MNLQWKNKVDNEDFVSAEDINAVANAIIKLQEDFEKNKMSEIDQTYDPESENAQSGKAVAEAVAPKMDKFADVTIEKQGDKIKKVLLDVIKNTKANDNTSLVFEIIHKLFDGGPLSKLALTYGYARLISDYCSELNGGSAKVQVGDIERIGNYKFFGTDENGNYYSLASKITAEILGVSGMDGVSPIRIINVADPKNGLDVANKQYVDSLVGDIETALDNIITMQNNLIGGGNV